MHCPASIGIGGNDVEWRHVHREPGGLCLKPRTQCLIEAVSHLLKIAQRDRLEGSRLPRLKVVARTVAIEYGDASEFGSRDVVALTAPQ
ncbi:hypothetical protein D3C85_1524500 [compost metagenome]